MPEKFKVCEYCNRAVKYDEIEKENRTDPPKSMYIDRAFLDGILVGLITDHTRRTCFYCKECF